MAKSQSEKSNPMNHWCSASEKSVTTALPSRKNQANKNGSKTMKTTKYQ
ncbi:hypothetical protein [Methanobrevibacter sp.]